MGIFRFYLARYTAYNSKPPSIKSGTQAKNNIDNRILARCSSFVATSVLLTDSSFKSRKSFYCKKPSGLLQRNEAVEAPDPMASLMQMSSGNNMADALKNNLSMGISTMAQYAWVSYFFSGFVIGKVPFPLTQRFRGMLQSGLKIQNLDVKFISSLSLYLLVLFGLSGLQTLVLGDDTDADEMSSLNDVNAGMKAQMGMMGGGGGMPGQAPDYNKLYQSERGFILILIQKVLNWFLISL